MNFRQPEIEEVDAAFEKIYSAFTLFNYKEYPELEVWGLDAHKAADTGLGIATEGDGPRNAEIGSVFQIDEAETELQEILDENGKPTGTYEQVTIKKEKMHVTTPASIDLTKITPYLMAKIKVQDERIAELKAHLEENNEGA